MNTTATSLSSLSAEHSWLSGRSVVESERRLVGKHHYVLADESPTGLWHSDDDESILSIQARETDYAKDTSDTDSCDSAVEYEPVSDAHSHRDQLSHTDESEEEIICTQTINVCVAECVEEGEGEADSEGSESGGDPELGPPDYWRCARCRAANNTPLYRYCHRCFQVRKSLFPPRPRRPRRAPEPGAPAPAPAPRVTLLARSSSQTSDSAYNSQEFPEPRSPSPSPSPRPAPSSAVPALRELCTRLIRYKSDSTERETGARKRRGEREASPGPAAKRRASDGGARGGRGVLACLRARAAAAAEAGDGARALCVVCCAAPRSAVFVHTRVAHMCCCYRCAVRVWADTRRCPACNLPVRNVLKAVL